MNRVVKAEQLVGELEGFSSLEWERLGKHARFERFMGEYLTAKCLVDFWWHMRYGVYFRQMKHYFEPLHGPRGMAGFLMQWERERLGQREPVSVKFLVVAREECKTQEALAWLSWEFARDPNNRLLVRCYIAPKANQIMGSLRELLQTPGYRRRYPWVKPKAKVNGQWESWNDEEFRLERDEPGIRVPSAEAHGVRGDPTGGHFTLGLYDDFETMENAMSTVARAEMLAKWKNDSNLFMAGARRLLCGTPWSRNGLIHPVVSRSGEFKKHEYDVFLQPWYVEVFAKPFSGQEPRLDGDRVTFHDCTQTFPVLEGNLVYCEARIRFFNAVVKDVVEEVREVTWNNGTSFIVNRAIPEMLGQPLSYVIGTRKPVDPNRVTMDSVDWIPPTTVSDTRIARKSIHEKKREQGPLVFSSQMELDPVETTRMVLNPEWLGEVALEDIPAGERVYYRACDFATQKKTKASTVMTTGFWHRTGFYIQHIAYGERMSSMDKLLELFLGQLRVRQWGYDLLWTFLEEAMIETTLSEFVDQAEKDPFGFFQAREGYAGYAEQYFGERRAMVIRRYNLRRGGNETKTLRIAAQQPEWAAHRVFYVKGCPNIDLLMDQAKSFSLESNDPNDLLDTLADLIREGKPPAEEVVAAETGGNLYWKIQGEALKRTVLVETGGRIPGWKW
jgi:hypothetical protein